jgi:hypothetical protein
VGGLLQSNRRHAGSGITSAFRHLADLLKDKVVIRAGSDLGEKGRVNAEDEGQSSDSFREALQDQAKQIELEVEEGNCGEFGFAERLW